MSNFESLDVVDRIFRSIYEITYRGCWRSSLNHDRNGYARISVNRDVVLAHRVMYEALHDKIPPSLELDHTCKVRDCTNPDHLEPVTKDENIRRSGFIGAGGIWQANKTHCSNGHPYTEENTYRRPDTKARQCRVCRIQADRNSRRRIRQRKAGLIETAIEETL